MVDFRHLGFAVAEKVLTFFVANEMHALKSKLADELFLAFESGQAKLEAGKVYAAILDSVTKTILGAWPRTQIAEESIFEEDQDLLAQLVQKDLKSFFGDFKHMIFSLVDHVHDLTI